jgi:signal transduction histidine kinase
MKFLRQRLALKHLVYVMSCGGFLALILAGIQLYVDYRKDVTQVYDALSIIRTSYIPALVTSRYDLDKINLARQDLESLNATLTEKNAALNQEIKKRELAENQLNQAQKMESVGRLAGGVAHDFNNMLGVILGHTELALLQADENHDLHADLKEIQTAAKRSADITKQLLAFARKQIISPKQIDLNDTAENMLNMLRRLIGEGIDLVWQPSSHLWPVKMDPSQIDQILVNLCVNARDAISGVGKLTIETGRKSCMIIRSEIPETIYLSMIPST